MWHTLTNHLEVLYGAGVALGIVILLTPAVGGMARMLGVVDRPGARRLNRRAVPRLGGLALFFGIFVPALAFLPLGRETKGLLLGAAVATTVGAIDDFRGLVWWEKLGGLIAAALGRPEPAILAAIVLGACIGFLRHNFYPARIFMGDSGALLLGFTLATLSVEGLLKTASIVSLFLPLAV